MPIRSLTGTAMLLAIALLAQSLRLIIPIPPQVSLFVIGSLVSTCIIVATWRFGFKSGLAIAWVTPVVAYLQGIMLPILPAILVVGLGSSLYACWARFWQGKSMVLMVLCAVLSRLVVLYGGFSWLLSTINIPGPKASLLLFSMGWPQLVTGTAGIVLAAILMRRMRD